jgi:hypothetical protein
VTLLKRKVTLLKRYGFLLLGGMVVLGVLELGESLSIPGVRDISIISSAEARVGRPITPVSVAGVARRTSRR